LQHKSLYPADRGKVNRLEREDRADEGRTKGVFALGAYQPSACRVYPPAALRNDGGVVDVVTAEIVGAGISQTVSYSF
jgi:hypothetical protein